MTAVRAAGAVSRRLRDIASEWWLPAVAATALLGPVLGRGVLFGLDLVVPSRLTTPAGFWGLGPELPRRVPMWSLIAWMSSVVPATLTVKALMWLTMAGGWVGMARLARRLGVEDWLVAHAAGALYAVGPFVLTRTLVGHLMITVPNALLPWVLPVLLRPGHRRRATFLACLALGTAGHVGGATAVVVVVVAVACGARVRGASAIAVAVAAQAPWLVPGAIVAGATDLRMASSAAFPTAADGLGGLLRLSAGGGFWNTSFQVGAVGAVGTVAGGTLLCAALLGTRALAPQWRRPLATLGAVGWLVAAASAIPGLATAYGWVDTYLLAGLWREGHRMLGLHLVWLAPAAALGGQRAAESAGRRMGSGWSAPVAAVPLAVAMALAVPGLGGFAGRLRAEQMPQGWDQARALVQARPGTVVAFPWTGYFNVVLEGRSRRMISPLPFILGADVVTSSANGLEPDVQEVGDPRERAVGELVEPLRRGEYIAARLGALGVRWVAVIETERVARYRALWSDPGLDRRIDGDRFVVWEVRSWRGEATTDAGTAVDVANPAPFLAIADSGRSFLWNRAGSSGWRRGWAAVAVTGDGRLRVPAGGGWIWYVWSPLAVAGAVVPWGCGVWCLLWYGSRQFHRTCHRRRRAGDDEGRHR